MLFQYPYIHWGLLCDIMCSISCRKWIFIVWMEFFRKNMLGSFALWIHLTPMLFFCLLFVVLTSVFVRVGCGNLLLLCVGVSVTSYIVVCVLLNWAHLCLGQKFRILTSTWWIVLLMSMKLPSLVLLIIFEVCFFFKKNYIWYVNIYLSIQLYRIQCYISYMEYYICVCLLAF